MIAFTVTILIGIAVATSVMGATILMLILLFNRMFGGG